MKRDFEDEFWGSATGSGDCDVLSRAVVAWFDGEASAEEERLARRHLESCLRCAEMWRDWSSARYLWQGARTPSPPIGLLTRILQPLVCTPCFMVIVMPLKVL